MDKLKYYNFNGNYNNFSLKKSAYLENYKILKLRMTYFCIKEEKIKCKIRLTDV